MGSTKNNPKALANLAITEQKSIAPFLKEYPTLLSELAKGGDFTKRFDAAAFAGNKSALKKLIIEGGLKTTEFDITEIGSDVKVVITITHTGKKTTITITISW